MIAGWFTVTYKVHFTPSEYVLFRFESYYHHGNYLSWNGQDFIFRVRYLKSITTNHLYFVDVSKPIYKYKEKLVILQSIGIIVIKSKETRVVTYTCRYSSGHFIPNSS